MSLTRISVGGYLSTLSQYIIIDKDQKSMYWARAFNSFT